MKPCWSQTFHQHNASTICTRRSISQWIDHFLNVLIRFLSFIFRCWSARAHLSSQTRANSKVFIECAMSTMCTRDVFRMSLEEYLVLHVREGVPVPRSALSAVALAFQLLKIIEAAPTLQLSELGSFLQRHCALKLQKEMSSQLYCVYWCILSTARLIIDLIRILCLCSYALYSSLWDWFANQTRLQSRVFLEWNRT